MKSENGRGPVLVIRSRKISANEGVAENGAMG